MKNSLFKRAFAIMLSLLMSAALAACRANYDWPKEGVGSELPKPSSLKGEVYTAAGRFDAVIECSESAFEKYADKCRKSGFSAEEYTDGSGTVYLYDADGCMLSLSYANKHMSIYLNAPITLGNDKWPDNAAAKQVPKPKSDSFGKVAGAMNDKNERAFMIYAGLSSHSEFSDYVADCKAAGFSNVKQDEATYFDADNGEYELLISYEGVNVMRVSAFPKR